VTNTTIAVAVVLVTNIFSFNNIIILCCMFSI